MIKIPDYIRQLFATAVEDGSPCLLGTISKTGFPQISPKGSMMVFDDETLCYWERSNRTAIQHVADTKHAVVYYRTTMHRANIPSGRGAFRLYGDARVVEDGPIADKVWDLVPPAEKKQRAKEGCAVLIRVDRIEDLLGRVIQSRD